MKRYYFRLAPGTNEIIERSIYDSAEAPTGLTEVTQAQFDGVHDPTRIYTFSGGNIANVGDRPPIWEGTFADLGPDRPDAFVE